MSMIASDLESSPSLSTRASAIGEAVRYFAASLAALALDAGLLWIGFTVFAWPAWIAGAVGYAAGLVFVYLLSIRWVFARRTVRDARGEFLVFAALGVVGLVLNSATLQIATGLGIALPVAKALSAGIGFTANFASRKLILFSGARR